MKNTEQTLKEWMKDNNADIITEINEELKIGTNWMGEKYIRNGSRKSNCYSEVNRKLGYKVEDLLNNSKLTYDGLPLTFKKIYDQTRNDTTSNRSFDFELGMSMGEQYDEYYEEVREKLFNIAEIRFIVEVKLVKVSNNNEYLVKGLELVSDDSTISELVDRAINYKVNEHKSAQQKLIKEVERCKKELNEYIEQLDNGIFEDSYSLNTYTKWVQRASESAQKAIEFFNTIEEIKDCRRVDGL